MKYCQAAYWVFEKCGTPNFKITNLYSDGGKIVTVEAEVVSFSDESGDNETQFKTYEGDENTLRPHFRAYYTDNGIRYEESLYSRDGMAFFLQPIKGYHSKESVEEAKRILRSQRDVVKIEINWVT